MLFNQELPRILGTYGGDNRGPLLICLGGIHGNEPAGVVAAQRVLEDLHARRPTFQGEFVALTGNRAALARGRRYIQEDLNRLWFPERIKALRSPSHEVAFGPEDYEQQQLLNVIESLLARRQGPVVFLDLHTTSAGGVPFLVISDVTVNRRLASGLPAPVILGLEEYLDGTVLSCVNEQGYIAIGFEGGQHEDPSVVKNHEAVVWLTMLAIGCVRQQEVIPIVNPLREHLAEQTRRLPRMLEIRYRHPVGEEDKFAMEPGYLHFQKVEHGQLLARDRQGEIRAQEEGFILMPLYQNQGSDGFFLVREIKPFWLSLSNHARRLGLETILPWLPGVQHHPEEKDTFILNLRRAPQFINELFHLLGFRRERSKNGSLFISRRRQDVVALK
jgi:succinylglutamate desuccinylase